MASLKKRLASNVPGDFYVDATCIDCDTCRWMAPKIFDEKEGKSRVHRQPNSEADRRRALMALVACPTGSIGTTERHDLKPVFESFPDPLDENVYHCGYHSEASFGAASYLIVRPEGNILVDSPRFASQLVKRLEDLGGVRTLFLTHGDDVADHKKFHDHFGCERILHSSDVKPSTRDVEVQISGLEPARLGNDVLLIPVPGHTRGSVCLLYQEKFLFTGDHAAWDPEEKKVYAFRNACWYDWKVQRGSMRRLTNYRFEWILPGHGAGIRLSAEEMGRQIRTCVEEMGPAIL